MADVSLSNVVAGFVGGATGSVLAFTGALYLQTRSEQRLRRARLMALQTELRWNRIAVRSIVDEKLEMGNLTNDCWRDNYVALAADLPAKVYSNLRLIYFPFPRVVEAYDLLKQPQPSDDAREFLVWWSDEAEVMQGLVTRELHFRRKLRSLMSSLLAAIQRRLPGSRDEKASGKGQE